MAEHQPLSDGKHNVGGASYSGNGRSGSGSGSTLAVGGGEAAAGGGNSSSASTTTGGGGGLSGGLAQPAGWQSLLSFTVLFLAWLAGFSARLFAVIRFESIIHEFDPW